MAEELRVLGHDAVTIQERGRGNEAVPGLDVLRFAILEGRAIVTLNRKDFIRLHHERPNHGAIIVCTVDPDFTGQARRIDATILSQPSTQ